MNVLLSLKNDATSMKNIVTLNMIINQTRYLAMSVLATTVLLSGCQPNDSLYVAPSPNNNHVNNHVNNGGNNHVNNDTNKNLNNDSSAVKTDHRTISRCDNDTIIKAFNAQQSDRQVKGCGTIIKALADDNDGSRHQKILVELDGVRPKQTLLLVHNIDLAPRVADVSRGTAISFYGEYVYNEKGGLVHWTHHDPAARHQGGWIESAGVHYD